MQSLNVPQGLPKPFMVLQGGFVVSDIIFGGDNPIYKPSPVWELGFLTQFSGFTTLQSLVLEKQCEGESIKHGLVYEEWQPHI